MIIYIIYLLNYFHKHIELAVRFQISQIRYVLFELLETSDDPKIKREVDCLAIYELENFEFFVMNEYLG